MAFFFILLIIIFLLVVHKDKVLIFVLNEHDPTPAHARISLKYIVGIILFFIKTLFLLASPLMSVFFIFYIHFHCNLNHGLCPRVHLCMHWLDGRSTVTWVFRLLPTCLVGDICGCVSVCVCLCICWRTCPKTQQTLVHTGCCCCCCIQDAAAAVPNFWSTETNHYEYGE